MKTQSPRKSGVVTSLSNQIGRAGMFSMIIATLAVISAGSLANVPSVLLGDIVDKIVVDHAPGAVWSVFALIVACLVGRVVLVVIQKYLIERTIVGVQKRVFLGNVTTVLGVRVDALQHMRVGEVNSRLEKRTLGTIRFLKLVFLETIPQLAVAIPALVFAFMQSLMAGAVMLIVLALSVATTTGQILSQKGIRITLINKTTGLAGQVAELLSHLDYVRASGMAGRVEARFESEAEEMRAVEFLHHKWMMGFDAVKGLIEDGGLALIVGIGIYQVTTGDMTPGTILALAMLFKSAAIPLQNLHRIVDQLHESVLQIDAAHSVLDSGDDASLAGNTMPAWEPASPIVTAKALRLSRTSPDGEQKTVLDGVDFDIHAGDVIGIAGPSGGGKTTLLRAMLGLFPDYQGELRLFGAEVRDLSKDDFADWISYGPQKPYVRQASLKANIVEGVVRQGDVANDVIVDALKQARLQLDPAKTLTERGDNISPGQVQRLSLARVFAKNEAKLVILDEATSMLDGSTQAEIMQELRRHAKGRAMVMVAHRLDTLRWADRILVLDGGQIVQSGTYDELEARPGVFATLLGERTAHHLSTAE